MKKSHINKNKKLDTLSMSCAKALPVEIRCAVSEPAGEVGQRARPQVVPVHGAPEGGGRAAAVRGREHVRHHRVAHQQLLDRDRLAPWQRERCPV